MGGEWKMYEVYGIRLYTDFEFRSALPETRSAGPPDLTFRCSTGGPRPAPTSPVFHGSLSDESGQPLFQAFRSQRSDVIRYTDVADFIVSDDHVECRIRDETYLFALELYFLGTVMSVWLERAGALVLHASGAVVNGVALGFLGDKGAGKSSLALGLTALGAEFLTDDLLVLRESQGAWTASPAFPEIRMWPEQVDALMGGADALPRAHPLVDKRLVPVERSVGGRIASRAVPIGELLLPARTTDADRCGYRPLTGSEQIVTLVRHSFIPNLAAALGMELDRFGRIRRLLDHVELSRFEYPDGVENLSAACDELFYRSARFAGAAT